MKKFLSLGCAVLLSTACTPSEPPANNEESQAAQKVVVATSFYPMTHFAKQVGGDFVDVQQVAPDGADPHSYEPTPQQIQQVYDADLLIFNGQGQEPWADRMHEELEGDGVHVLIATELVERLSYEEEDHEGHHDDEHHEDEHHEEEHEDDHHDEHDDHEDEHHDGHDEHDDHEDDHHDDHDHEHGEWDPHVWLDPEKVQQIVKTIASELSEINPSHAAAFNSNANAYVSQLQTLDKDMRTGLSNCALDAVIVSHDAFRYLAHRYGFHTLEIAGLSPSSEPSPARLAKLADIASEEGISHVFFETHVSPALSETLAQEIGAETLVLHSIEALTQKERAEQKTYIDLMRQNLANLRTAMECS